MVMTLLSSGPGFAAFTDRWRIPKADVQRLRDAGQLLAAASDRANRAEARAADQEAQARQRGYEAGLREGRAAGAAEAAHALTAVVREVRAGQNELKESLGALSLDVVRRGAPRLGPQAVLEALVEQAVREILSDQPLSVHAAPDAAAGLAARLWPLNAEIEVVADAQVPDGACVIVTPRGSAHVGLELQLAALERAFQAAEWSER